MAFLQGRARELITQQYQCNVRISLPGKRMSCEGMLFAGIEDSGECNQDLRRGRRITLLTCYLATPTRMKMRIFYMCWGDSGYFDLCKAMEGFLGGMERLEISKCIHYKGKLSRVSVCILVTISFPHWCSKDMIYSNELFGCLAGSNNNFFLQQIALNNPHISRIRHSPIDKV